MMRNRELLKDEVLEYLGVDEDEISEIAKEELENFIENILKPKGEIIEELYDYFKDIYNIPDEIICYINFDDYTATDIPAIWSLNATNDSVFCKIISCFSK